MAAFLLLERSQQRQSLFALRHGVQLAQFISCFLADQFGEVAAAKERPLQRPCGKTTTDVLSC
jgi:hypothetical protein